MAEQAGANIEVEFVPRYRFWTDKVFYFFLILALLADVALFGVIQSVYPQLPERLPILFNAQGQADLVANKVYLYRLPLGVALLILANGAVCAFFIKRSAFAARMLMLTTCWLGLLLLAGLWFIIR
ncbi:MAG: hypothetical protein OXM03_02195 [Chloroflexota bacterium]|nr:hypothetical protein [Chloroflexota bacterium]MDE2839419.1 hypothetical protein [Chloroflexota bacterium]MDE2931877.1 hypothetical protein [Chloroflexota bacterium]